jgi:hypothetical protein
VIPTARTSRFRASAAKKRRDPGPGLVRERPDPSGSSTDEGHGELRVIGLWREVEPLQGIIEDVTRWLRNSGHPQIRRELLHHLPEFRRDLLLRGWAEEGPRLLAAPALSVSAAGF